MWSPSARPIHVVGQEDRTNTFGMRPRGCLVQHIDTAVTYGNEAEVGAGLKPHLDAGRVKREDLFVTTKLWSDQHARDAVVPALKDSLKRLGLAYVDLFLVHWPVTDEHGPSLEPPMQVCQTILSCFAPLCALNSGFEWPGGSMSQPWLAAIGTSVPESTEQRVKGFSPCKLLVHRPQ